MKPKIKKFYTTPQLIVHGNVEEITQQNGSSRIDVPTGTSPVGNSVTS